MQKTRRYIPHVNATISSKSSKSFRVNTLERILSIIVISPFKRRIHDVCLSFTLSKMPLSSTTFVHSSVICLPEKVNKWIQYTLFLSSLQVTILGQLFPCFKNCFHVILLLEHTYIFQLQGSKIDVIHVNLWYVNIL